MGKMKLEVTGLNQILKRMQDMNADTKKAVTKALSKTHKIVTDNAEAAIEPHKLSGATEASLRKEPVVQWNGDVASVSVGFDIAKGGIASIFLMYGTPRVKKDTKLYNAFYGSKVIEEIIRAQEEILYSAIQEAER